MGEQMLADAFTGAGTVLMLNHRVRRSRSHASSLSMRCLATALRIVPDHMAALNNVASIASKLDYPFVAIRWLARVVTAGRQKNISDGMV